MDEISYWRSRHTSLIFALRTIAERFGDEALDILAEHHLARVRESFAKRALEYKSHDLLAFADLLGNNPVTHTKNVLRADRKLLEFEITHCIHADIFAECSALDLGLKFMCSGDFAMAEGFNPMIDLRRPCTLMQGDGRCHFIYRLRDS